MLSMSAQTIRNDRIYHRKPAAAVWPRSASGLAERDPGGAQADAGRGGSVAGRESAEDRR